MGDLIGQAIDDTLYFVPPRTFERVRRAAGSPEVRAQLFADLCRINALYMIARAGSGHIGSSFSSLDLVSWIVLNELDPRAPNVIGDLYFSSKGHDVPGLYAALIGMGALAPEMLHGLRQVGGLPGHPDVGTLGIVTNTGSLGMGISKAKGMILAHRARRERRRVFVLTGDGELQEGQIWESLATAVQRRMDELTVIVDHNKLQSDSWVHATSDLGDLEAKFESFGWHVSRVDGHDLAAVSRLLGELHRVENRPKVVIADTIKGRGVSFMEYTSVGADGLYRYHSGAPDAAAYRRALLELADRVGPMLERQGCGPLLLERVAPPPRVARPAADALIAAYGTALLREAERHPELLVLDADLAVDMGLQPFRERYPERHVECGIAEMDMVSQAGGMALRGALPICHSFAAFLSARPNEQIYNNATEHSKVVYVAGLSGLLPAGPGHSHQSVRDISALGAIAGLCMLQPCSPEELELSLRYLLDVHESSGYLRLCSFPWHLPFQLPVGHHLVLGRGVSVRSGEDGVITAYGPVMLSQAYLAAQLLSERHGIELEVIDLPWLNQLDRHWLAQAIGERGWLFTLDDHATSGGQGQMICASVLEAGLSHVRAQRFGVDGIPACGAPEAVLRAHGLDADSLCRRIAQKMENTIACALRARAS